VVGFKAGIGLKVKYPSIGVDRDGIITLGI
jgi:hypothetical protein